MIIKLNRPLLSQRGIAFLAIAVKYGYMLCSATES